jgi:hypothetical protein
VAQTMYIHGSKCKDDKIKKMIERSQINDLMLQNPNQAEGDK